MSCAETLNTKSKMKWFKIENRFVHTYTKHAVEFIACLLASNM